MARKLAAEKGRSEEFEFMERIERLAVQAVYDVKGQGKKLCANVDFYSGFVYDLIGLPEAIYTPSSPCQELWAGVPTATRNWASPVAVSSDPLTAA